MSPLKSCTRSTYKYYTQSTASSCGINGSKGGPLADHGWHGPKPSAMFVTGLSSGLCTYFRACKVAMVFGCFIGFTPTSQKCHQNKVLAFYHIHEINTISFYKKKCVNGLAFCSYTLACPPAVKKLLNPL